MGLEECVRGHHRRHSTGGAASHAAGDGQTFPDLEFDADVHHPAVRQDCVRGHSSHVTPRFGGQAAAVPVHGRNHDARLVAQPGLHLVSGLGQREAEDVEATDDVPDRSGREGPGRSAGHRSA